MVKSFEEAAFSMEAGGISEIVRSTFGFHIIKVTDIKESSTQSLEEVKPRIITTVTSEKAKMMALQKAQKLADLSVKDETSLKETASKEGFEVSDTDFFSKEEKNNPIAVNPDLSDSAFSMRKGEISNALEIPGSVFVLAILDRQEEHLPTFDEASNSARSFIKEQKSSEMASKKAQEYLDQLSEGKVFSALAKDNNLKVEETGLFSLKQGFIPGMNIRATNGSSVLSLNESSPHTQLNNNSKNFIVKLKETKTPSEEDFEKEKEQIKRNLVKMKRREFFNKWLESLRNKADIKINMELI
jgi:peptidyl-prolyl cis-trans isomerase D